MTKTCAPIINLRSLWRKVNAMVSRGVLTAQGAAPFTLADGDTEEIRLKISSHGYTPFAL